MAMILVLILLTGIAVIHKKSRGKYAEQLSHIDKAHYPMKELLPLGIWIVERTGIKFNTKYDMTVNAQMLELYGAKWSKFYLMIHWANRFTYLLLGMLFGSLIVAGSDTMGEGLLSAGLLVGMVAFLPDVDLKNRVKKRRTSMQVDFPEFLNKLTLLVDAGLPVSGAWTKIVEDSKSKSDRPLYREMELVYLQIRSGKSEITAYEEFAKRCRMLEVTKFAAVLLMNLRKGSGELVSSLKTLSDECWQGRVHMAKRQGEEASTRLLFPMMLMLAGVMIIVIIPVILEFRNI